MNAKPITAETRRLAEDERRRKNWKRWGPYLAERQWGTVREDYSADGDGWISFPHDQARARAYRWGEDGLLGITDRECRLCFALALWNGRDPILKERFGGNSNWRGPVWFPVNYVIIEALERYDYFYGDTLRVECPTGSGEKMRLSEVAREIERRLLSLFQSGVDGARPCHGGQSLYAADPHWRDLILFYEYFHGETGQGLGAGHQTGWTALVTHWLSDR